MSGRKQHYIPQALLRGFSSDGKRISTYERGKAYETAVSNVAAERDFYSAPSCNGTRSLDDTITDYEGDELPWLLSLRTASIGKIDDPDKLAEAVSHFALRNKSARNFMNSLLEALLSGLPEKFLDLGWFVRASNFHTLHPNQAALTFLRQELKSVPQYVAASPSQRRAMERQAYEIGRSQLSEAVGPKLPVVAALIQNGVLGIMERISDQHRGMLQKSLYSDSHTSELLKFSWQIMETVETLILPDCAVVSVDRQGDPFPFLFCERQQGVLFPISSHRLVVGWRGTIPRGGIDTWLAAASDVRFFAERADEPRLAELATTIGSARSRTLSYFLDLVSKT